MPRFPGCENLVTDAEKKKCADEKMLEYIYQNLKYPAIARESAVEGTVVVSFIVEADGSISDAKVLRDIGAGCGDEALRLVKGMNNIGKWTPGKQRNQNVSVQYNLPIRFKTDGIAAIGAKDYYKAKTFVTPIYAGQKNPKVRDDSCL